MAYREFDNFNPTSVKPVTPLEGIGDAILKGVALGQRAKANDQANKLAQTEANRASYKDLKDIDTAEILETDTQQIKDFVATLAKDKVTAQLKGINPIEAGILKRTEDGQKLANISKQDRAEVALRKEQIKALPDYIDKDELLGRLNAETMKGLGSRDWKAWDETLGNLKSSPELLKTQDLVNGFLDKHKAQTVTEKTVKDNGINTRTDSLTFTGIDGTSRTKSGEIVMEPAKRATLLDNLYKYDGNSGGGLLFSNAEKGVLDQVKKEISGKYPGENVDALLQKWQLNPAAVLLNDGRNLRARIDDKVWRENVVPQMQVTYNREVANNIDTAEIARRQKEREDKAKEQVKLDIKPDDSFMAYSATEKDGKTTVSNEKRYSIASVNFKKGNKSGIELNGVQLNDLAFDYSTGKFIKPEESPIANRDFTVSRGDVVIRDMSKGGFVKVRSKEEAMRLIGKATNPQDLQIDILYRATVKDEATGTQNSTTSATKTTKDLTTDEQADQNIDVKETTTVSDKSAKKTYGLFGSDVNGHLSAMGVDVQAAIQKQKSYQDISGALKKAQSGKATASTKANPLGF